MKTRLLLTELIALHIEAGHSPEEIRAMGLDELLSVLGEGETLAALLRAQPEPVFHTGTDRLKDLTSIAMAEALVRSEAPARILIEGRVVEDSLVSPIQTRRQD